MGKAQRDFVEEREARQTKEETGRK